MTKNRFYRSLFLLLMALLFAGCSPSEQNTFAGFTFGGGGNTFSAEPCHLGLEGSKGGSLIAGAIEQDTYLELRWDTEQTSFSGQSVELSDAKVKVATKGGLAVLKEGQIVLQARDGGIAHGSYDVFATLDDGRVVEIVGSFTSTVSP